MQRTISGLLILVGIIHILPFVGVLGAERLSMLYGVEFQESNMVILMQHRAVLFGLLGSFFILSATRHVLQPIAFVAGYVSVISFIVLSLIKEEYNEAISQVIVADVVALFCLIVATILYFIGTRQAE